jgi:hypothetical protein
LRHSWVGFILPWWTLLDSDDAYASLHVNGTDRDGQNDNCAAGDSGFQVAFL